MGGASGDVRSYRCGHLISHAHPKFKDSLSFHITEHASLSCHVTTVNFLMQLENEFEQYISHHVAFMFLKHACILTHVVLIDECGIVAQVSTPLALAEISTYYICTFYTDHTLVRADTSHTHTHTHTHLFPYTVNCHKQANSTI